MKNKILSIITGLTSLAFIFILPNFIGSIITGEMSNNNSIIYVIAHYIARSVIGIPIIILGVLLLNNIISIGKYVFNMINDYFIFKNNQMLLYKNNRVNILK